MDVISFREYDNCKRILGKNDKYFVSSTDDIKGIAIGGISNDLRYVSYNVSDDEPEVIILEVLKDDERYFFKPIFSDDCLLILSEDYCFGDSDELSIGEIRLSTNRQAECLKTGYNTFKNDDYSSIYDNKDLVLDNPIGVYLSSLMPVSILGDKADRMINYNKMYADDLRKKIDKIKFDAQTLIMDDYDRVLSKKYVR